MGSEKYCLFFISVLLILYLNHETTVNCLYRKHKDSKKGTFRPERGGEGGGGGSSYAPNDHDKALIKSQFGVNK